jgi:hypothetical protein
MHMKIIKLYTYNTEIQESYHNNNHGQGVQKFSNNLNASHEASSIPRHHKYQAPLYKI